MGSSSSLSSVCASCCTPLSTKGSLLRCLSVRTAVLTSRCPLTVLPGLPRGVSGVLVSFSGSSSACSVGSAAWITISYSSFAIASASSISISSSARLARGIAPRRTLADGAVSAHSRMAVGMIVATFAATHALQNESTHHPTPSSHRGSRLVPPPSPTASLDWTANSIGAWDSRNPEVRDLSHSKTQIPTAWV